MPFFIPQYVEKKTIWLELALNADPSALFYFILF